MRAGRTPPPVTFGARESEEVVAMVHGLEAEGTPRARIVLMGRSLGASVGLLALARLEREGRGPLGGIIWEGAPASSRDFAERLVRGPRDRFWHPLARPAHRRPGQPPGRPWRAATVPATPTCWPGPPACAWRRPRSASSPPRTGSRRRRCSGRWPPASRPSSTVEVPTWHLHCSEVLGARYAEAIRQATQRWLGGNA